MNQQTARGEYRLRPGAPAVAPPADGVWEDVSLGQRIRQPRTLLSFAFAAVVVVFALTRLDINPRSVLSEMSGANVLYLGIAAGTYYGSFGLRAARWRSILMSAKIEPAPGRSLPAMGGMVVIFLLSWFANCIVPAKLGDAYRGFLLKRRSGTSFSGAMGTIFAERLVDLVMLSVVLVGSGLLVFGRHVPAHLTSWMFLAIGIGAGLVVGCLIAYRLRNHLRRLVPERLRVHYVRLEEGVFGSFGRFPALVSWTTAIWLLEGVRLYFVGLSVGAQLTISSALFVALLASLLTAVPLTPAGLGIVELGIVGALVLLGLSEQAAASVAILDRVIAYWSVILVGAGVYLGTRWVWRKERFHAALPAGQQAP